MTIPKPSPSGHVAGHYVEDPAKLLPNDDAEYYPHFVEFLAKRYKMKKKDVTHMAKAVLAGRRNPAAFQEAHGEVASQGLDDIVAFGKEYNEFQKARYSAGRMA